MNEALALQAERTESPPAAPRLTTGSTGPAWIQPGRDGWKPVPRRWTREEYYRLGEAGIFNPAERMELIEGEILPMPPQGTFHSTGTCAAHESLYHAFSPDCTVRVQMPLSLGLASDPEPDLAVVRGSFRDYRIAHPTTALLVVEVSDTTLAYDRCEKASLYARAGLADYWIVNVLDQQVEVHRHPRPNPDMPFGYGYASITVHHVGDEIVPLAAPTALVAVADLLP